MGGKITGHSRKPGLFGTEENFDFTVDIDWGGINLNSDIIFEEHQIPGSGKRPIPVMQMATIDINKDRVDIGVNSGDLGPMITGATLKTKIFRDLFIDVLNLVLKNGRFFEPACNEQIKNIVASPDH
jgi:hypothetical protein